MVCCFLICCIMACEFDQNMFYTLFMWNTIQKSAVCIILSHTQYRKFPKYSDTQKICCNHSKIWTMWLYHRVMSPNDADGMAYSVDPDQTAPIWVCTVCPGLSVRKLRIIRVVSNCFLTCTVFTSYLYYLKAGEVVPGTTIMEVYKLCFVLLCLLFEVLRPSLL